MRRTGPSALFMAAALLLAGVPARIAGQAANTQTCAAVYQDRFGQQANGDACQALAGDLVLQVTDAFWDTAAQEANVQDQVGPGEMQPASSGPSSAAGSVAQTEAVPSGQPLALGGGSIAAVGSDAGAGAITSLTFNPAIFFGGDAESEARMSRLADLTVFFPVDELDRDEDGSIDYFGVRLRVNFTGLSAGSRVWSDARSRFEGLLTRESSAMLTLLDRVRSMDEMEMRACADALRPGAGPTSVQRACEISLVTPAPEEYAALREALDRVRTAADSRYFGLDLRLEVGDPTLGVVPEADAVAINAGMSFGRQFVGTLPDPLAPSAGIRARAGVRYTDLRSLDEASFALDGAVAFVMKRPITVEQSLTISAGAELRYGDADDTLRDEFQSNFVTLRAGLTVPITGQTEVAMGFSHPIIGEDVSPSLSVTGAWKLLLPLTSPP